MVSRLDSVSFDVRDQALVSAFWAGLLDREVVAEAADVALVPGDETQVGLRFERSASRQVGPRRLHLHLTSTSLEDQARKVERVLDLGGRHFDAGQEQDATFVVMADPEGNELCVIEPGNDYLAGTGLLGEVSCDGTRAVGLFWRDALGWPLVWDENDETAVQSPLGGTKVAWGGPPVEPQHGRTRQRFDLVTDDVAAESARLVSLGASVVGDLRGLEEGAGAVELTDPDGTAFGLRPGPGPSPQPS
jgi:predicted enzyme related to lactoylglutathione lyase